MFSSLQKREIGGYKIITHREIQKLLKKNVKKNSKKLEKILKKLVKFVLQKNYSILYYKCKEGFR